MEPVPNVTVFDVLVASEAVSVRVLMGIPGMIIEKDLNLLTQTTVVSFFSEPVGENLNTHAPYVCGFA